MIIDKINNANVIWSFDDIFGIKVDEKYEEEIIRDRIYTSTSNVYIGLSIIINDIIYVTIIRILPPVDDKYSFYADMEQYVLTNIISTFSDDEMKEIRQINNGEFIGHTVEIRQIDEYGFLIESSRDWKYNDIINRESKWIYNSRITPLTYNGIGNKF